MHLVRIDAGPLTTTFTAPASCPSAVGYIELTATSAAHFEHQVACDLAEVDLQVEPCMPPWHSNFSAHTVTYDDAVAFQPIYSPGLYCALGWTTAGTFVKDGTTARAASGIFSSSSNSDARDQVSAMLSVLRDKETVIWCAPSGYSNTDGLWSTVLGKPADLGITTYCDDDWDSMFGSRTTIRRTLDASAASNGSYQVQVVHAGIWLAHKAEDVSTTSGATAAASIAASGQYSAQPSATQSKTSGAAAGRASRLVMLLVVSSLLSLI